MNEKLKIDAKTIYYFLKATQAVKTKEWNYSIRPCVLLFNTWHSNIIAQPPKKAVSCSQSGLGGFGKEESFHNNFYVGSIFDGGDRKFGFFKSEKDALVYAYKSGMMESKLMHEQKELMNIKSRGFAKVNEIAKVLSDIDKAKELA
jgi:hypothetical protein